MARKWFLPLLFGLALTGQVASAAELVVINSTVKALRPGQIVQDSDNLNIPAGQSVTLVAQTGKTITLAGPHAGPAGLQDSGKADGNLVAALSGLLAGSGIDSTSIGVMRAKPLPLPSDPWMLDVYRSGNYCITPGMTVRIWRPKADAAESLTIKEMRPGKNKAEVSWAQGSAVASWPEAVPLAEGAIYLLRFSSAKTARKVVVRIIPENIKSNIHRAAWMGEQDCKKQARALLARIR